MPAIVRFVVACRPCVVFMTGSLAQDAALRPEKSSEIALNASRRSRSFRAQNGADEPAKTACRRYR